jgi:LAO/AO transport system kinase
VATSGDGVAELWQAVVAHRAAAEASGELDRRRRARRAGELRQALADLVERRAREAVPPDLWAEVERHVLAGDLDPRAAALRLLPPP